MTTDSFVYKWNDFKSKKGFHQRIDSNHPLDFFIGVNEKGYDELLLITVNEPAVVMTGKSLEISKKVRKDGRWALVISSVYPENQEVFARLCLDLFESSKNCTNEKDGLNLIVKRFTAWQKLFMTIRDTLNESVLKGLVGEIIFADKHVSNHYSWNETFESWQGPDGADRDFVLQDKWFEVKTISIGKKTVTISSLNQLETDIPGYIVVVYIEKTTSTDPEAVSVAELIRSLRKKLENSPEALLKFEQKLVSIGYIDKEAYENIFFRYSEDTFYLVDLDLPRLTTKNVPSEVVSAHYELSLSAIEKWKRDVNTIWN